MRFSIVTPSFNQLNWLKLCIESVRDQITNSIDANAHAAHRTKSSVTSLNKEFLGISVEHIVQDAGTSGIEEFARAQRAAFYRNGEKIFEDTGGVVDDIANNSKSGIFQPYSLSIYSEKDLGMYDALNKGFARASGEICAYLNCDEQYMEGALKFIASWFSKHRNIDIAFGNIVVTDNSGNYICDRTAVMPNRAHTLTGGSLSIFSAGTFFRRSVVARGLVFDPAWRVVGDSIWVLSVLRANLKGKLIRHRLAAFAYSSDNLSQQPYASEESQRLRAMATLPMRLFAPLTLAYLRFQRLLLGGYSIKPHSYRIFTRVNPNCRWKFQVLKPTHRWPSRP
jgi:glycosyltransferase involved in cell wall biosynthesis